MIASENYRIGRNWPGETATARGLAGRWWESGKELHCASLILKIYVYIHIDISTISLFYCEIETVL